MQITNIYEAKTKLSQLVDKTLDGDDIVIARAGKPLVRLVPYNQRKKERKPGRLKGKITFPSNFEKNNQEIENLFYGTEK